MFELKTNEENYVEKLIFSNELDHLDNRSIFGNADHEELAKKFNEENSDFFSVIITQDHLKDELWNDPYHVKKENHIICSIVEERARKEMTNSYFSIDQIDSLIEEFELNTWHKNYLNGNEKEKADNKIKSKIEDYIFEAQHYMLYPEIMEGFKNSCKYKFNEDEDDYEYDENDEPIELPEEEFRKSWEEEKLRILMPRTSITHERQTHMPEPFNWWDYRNIFQQWFFVDNKYINGGSGSSCQREYQGRYAHVFATLEKEYNKIIPTYVFVYNEENKMKFVRKYDSFKAVNRELSGNYFSKREIIDKLFKDKLVEINYDTRMVEEFNKQ